MLKSKPSFVFFLQKKKKKLVNLTTQETRLIIHTFSLYYNLQQQFYAGKDREKKNQFQCVGSWNSRLDFLPVVGYG